MGQCQYLILLSFAVTFSLSCQSDNSSKRQPDNSSSTSVDYVDTRMTEIRRPTVGELKFIAFWKQFIRAAKEKDLSFLKSNSNDTLVICNTRMTLNKFINECYEITFDKLLFESVLDSAYIKYGYFEDKKGYEIYGEPYGAQRVEVSKRETDSSGYVSGFFFVETENGYQFYKSDNNKNRPCCR